MDVNMAAPASEAPASDARPDAQSPGPGVEDPGVADPGVRPLVAAVDELSNLGSLPVEAHAARYREVHNVLQDALSDTDRGGPQPN